VGCWREKRKRSGKPNESGQTNVEHGGEKEKTVVEVKQDKNKKRGGQGAKKGQREDGNGQNTWWVEARVRTIQAIPSRGSGRKRGSDQRKKNEKEALKGTRTGTTLINGKKGSGK